VVNRVNDAEVRKGLWAGMKSILPVKIVGDDIRLGTTYKTKPDAVKALNAARNKGFTFQVVDNIVSKTTKVAVIRVSPIEDEQVSQAEEVLKKLNVPDAQIVVESLEKPAETPAP